MDRARVDFGKTAGDYGHWRAGFPPEFFDRLTRFQVGLEGQRILDLGTGTGTLARGFARRGCRVTGVDRAGTLLEEARRLDREAGVRVRYREAGAEDTGLPDHAFDAVTAGQCWHWFDRQKALGEVLRVLFPGGRFVIAHFNWLALPGNVAEATERLIVKHNPEWDLGNKPGIYPDWLRDVDFAGFREVESFSFVVPVRYNHDAWRGRIRASAGIAASLPPDRVGRFDEEHGRMLAERFPRVSLEVPHRVFAVISRAPGTTEET